MAYLEVVNESTSVIVEEDKVSLNVGEYTGFTGRYDDLLDKPASLAVLERIDSIIKAKNITATTYNGGSNNDKLSTIIYEDNYAEDLYYDANDKLQYIDHKLNGVVEGYTELTYTDSKFSTYTFILGAR